MMSISGAVLQGIAAMWTRRFLGLSAAVLLAMAGFGYGLHVAYADDTGRAMPTIGVTSPSPETIQVVWGAPGDTDTLNSYRVMWALEGQSHSYSEAVEEREVRGGVSEGVRECGRGQGRNWSLPEILQQRAPSPDPRLQNSGPGVRGRKEPGTPV